MSDSIFNKDTLLAAALHGGAAIAACYYLFPGQVGLNEKAIMMGVVLGVVTVAADKVFPRVQGYLSNL